MKEKYGLYYSYLVGLLAIVLISCKDIDDHTIQDIIIEQDELSVMVDDIAFIKTAILPKEANNVEIRWSSSNPEIASVHGGEVIGVKEGETIITATAGGITKICKVAVTNRRIVVTEVLFDKYELSITEEQSQSIQVYVIPENATNKNITWTSDNENIATVNGEGLITAIAEGEAFITATTEDGGKKISSKITVIRKGKVGGVTLNPSSISLHAGQNRVLTATVLPEDAINRNITWTSSNENIATVNQSGIVTAITAGDAIITVTTEDGEYTATCNVSITTLYSDDFNRPNTGRKGPDEPTGIGEDWSIVHGLFEIRENVLHAINSGSPSQAVILYKKPGAITRNNNGGYFILSVDITLTAASWAGVIFNAQDNNQYYVFRFQPARNQVQFLFTPDNGVSWDVLSFQTVKTPSFVMGSTCRLTIFSNELGKYSAIITDETETTVIAEYNLVDNKNHLLQDGYAGLWSQMNEAGYDNLNLEVK